MIRDEDHWVALTDAFYSAALGEEDWYPALEGLAQVTGSRTGQLVGFGTKAHSFNILTNFDPAWLEEPAAAGAADPGINPRVGIGLAAPPLKTLTEADFDFPDEYTRAPRHLEFEDFMRRIDRPHICLSLLERQSDNVIGLAVNRSKNEGHITCSQRAAFASLAPHVRAAVRMQMALEGQGMKLLVGALEALSVPAFVCDRAGKVHAFTPSAEQLADGECGLQLRKGQLHARHPEDARALNNAIAEACCQRTKPGSPALKTVIVRNDKLHSPSLALDVMMLPNRVHAFNCLPRVLVVARGERHAQERKSEILKTAYALTPAETAVAMQIAQGKTVDVIAAGRGVSVGTVRSQVKALLAKLGVHRQIEIAARVNAL